MRLNKFVALSTGLSRRSADELIRLGHVLVNDTEGKLGQEISPASDLVTLNGLKLKLPAETTTIMLNKPVGYVCSRDGQGSKTIYDLLPEKFHHLKPVGRLDKDSSGLLLLTNDGELAHRLTHPTFQKEKIYQARLDKPLSPETLRSLEQGIMLEDGISKLGVRVMRHETRDNKTHDSNLTTHDSAYEVRMSEGKNRQIRRTFEKLGYKVVSLHRVKMGVYNLHETELESGSFKIVEHF